MAADDTRIGGGYVEITSRVDKDQVRKDADKAGGDFEDTFSKTVQKRSKNDGSILHRAFQGIGAGLRSSLMAVVTGVLPVLGAVMNGVLAFAPILAHAAIVVGQFGGSLIQVSPILLSIGSSLLIATTVVKAFGPAFLKSFSPVQSALKAANVEASNLATRGVRPLAQEFVKMNMPAISDMMNRIARSTNGVVTSFLEWTSTAEGIGSVRAITKATADLFQNLAPWVRAVVVSFVAMLGRISAISSAVGTSGLTKVLQKVKDVLDGITAEGVQHNLDRLASSFQAMARFGKNAWTVLSGIWDFYKKWKTEIGLVSDALGILAIVFGGPITAIIAAVGIVIRHFDQLKSLVQNARSWFGGIQGGSDILSRLKDQAILVWGAITQGAATIWALVRGPLAQLWAVVQQQLLPALGNWAVAMGPIATFLITKLAPAVGTVLGFLIRFITFTVEVISAAIRLETALLSSGPKITAAYQAVLGWFQKLPGRIGAAIAAIPGLVLSLFMNVAKDMLYATGYAIGATIKYYVDLPGRAARAVARLWSAISGAFSNARSGASNAANSLVASAVRYFATLPGKARSAIASLPGRIKSVFAGAGSWLYSAGANILRGLVNGMKGAVGAAVNAAINAAKSVINGLKDGLGINSPSKVAEEEVGRFVMPGVARGIDKSMPAVQAQIKALAPATATSAVQAVAPAARAQTAARGPMIGNLTLVAHGFDPKLISRDLIKALYEALNKYQRSYA